MVRKTVKRGVRTVGKSVRMVDSQVDGFMAFIREQGVLGLAIGFILGGAVSGVVRSLVDDIINPLISLAIGSSDGLSNLTLGPVTYGNFIAVIIDFLIIAAVIYFGFKKLGIAIPDKKKIKIK